MARTAQERLGDRRFCHSQTPPPPRALFIGETGEPSVHHRGRRYSPRSNEDCQGVHAAGKKPDGT